MYSLGQIQIKRNNKKEAILIKKINPNKTKNRNLL